MAKPEKQSVHQTWSSKLAFVLATSGAAVGLGNLWGFPFLTGQHGGAAFIIIYLACVIFICLPIITAEIAMGRMGHMSPIGTIKKLVAGHKAGPVWKGIGILSLAVPFVGFTFYSIVAGWALTYAIDAFQSAFQGMDSADSVAKFAGFVSDPVRNILLQGVVIMATALVIGRGLHKGIEWATKVMMPALFVMLIGLALYGTFTGAFGEAFSFLFAPDFSEVTPTTVMVALGQSFFSVGVGVGFMITYGAYLPEKAAIPKLASQIVTLDTLVALLAGLAIFPIVFAAGLSPQEGPGLTFVTMPVAFGGMNFGAVIGFVFFLLLFVAAFTSTIGMLEPIVSWMEEKWQKSRFALSFSAALAIWAVGLIPALNDSFFNGARPLAFIPGLENHDVFTSFYFFTASIMIPANALLISLFAGWIITGGEFKKELGFKSEALFQAWRFLVKFLAPLAVLAITIYGLVG